MGAAAAAMRYIDIKTYHRVVTQSEKGPSIRKLNLLVQSVFAAADDSTATYQDFLSVHVLANTTLKDGRVAGHAVRGTL